MVFDTVADARKQYDPWIIRADNLPDGPIRHRTRFTESRTRGRTVAITVEYSDYDRPRGLVSLTRAPMIDITATLTFERGPAGTPLGWDPNLRPRGILRVLGPLLGRTGRHEQLRVTGELTRVLEAFEH